jgi:hypothetical protein
MRVANQAAEAGEVLKVETGCAGIHHVFPHGLARAGVREREVPLLQARSQAVEVVS